MNRDEFEPKLLELWMKTRIPLTRSHIQYHTGASRRRVDTWLDELVSEGVLELEVDGTGEACWTVPDAHRPIDGPETFAALERRESIRREARARVRKRAGLAETGTELVPAGEDDKLGIARHALSLGSKALGSLDKPRGKGEKSLLLSAGVSLLGPLGWLYAGSFREAIPAIALTMLIGAIVPNFLLMPLLWLAMPASAVAGTVYAWQYNRSGKRTTIFLDDPDETDDDTA